MREVFISFASADRAIADRLVRSLEQRGLSCWIAHRDIKAGENYQAQIPAAVEACAVVLVLYSRNAAKSQEIPKEMVLARTLRKQLIPLRIEDHKPEGAFFYEFVTSQYLDLFRDFDAVVDDLCQQLDEYCRKQGEVAELTRRAARRRAAMTLMLRGGLVAGALVCAAAAWKLAPALHSMGHPAAGTASGAAQASVTQAPASPSAGVTQARLLAARVADMPAAGMPAAGMPASDISASDMVVPPPAGSLGQRLAMAAMRSVPPTAASAVPLSPWAQKASDFAVTYYTMMGAPAAQSLAYLDSAVADPVRFVGKSIPRSRLIDEQRRYVARWPDRTFTIRPGSLGVTCRPSAQSCEVTGICDYRLHSEERGVVSSGAEQFTLVVSGAGDRLSSIMTTPLQWHTGSLAAGSLKEQ